MTGRWHRKMKEAEVVGVLRYIRAEIIRDGLDGLEHAEALLRARGVDPDALYVSRKVPKQFKRGKLRLAILRALQDGPMTGGQIVAAVAAGQGMAVEKARPLVHRRLSDMRSKGAVTPTGEG